MFRYSFPFLLISSVSLGQEVDRLYRSPYFIGRGDTGIAIADNADAIFYNPAGLAFGKGIFKEVVLLSPAVEVSSGVKDLARQVALEESTDVDTFLAHTGNPQHIGISNFSGIVLRRAAMGAFASGGINLLVSNPPESGGLESVEANFKQNLGFVFAIAQGYKKNRILFGVTGKYVRRAEGGAAINLADADKIDEINQDKLVAIGDGGGADVGVMFRSLKGKVRPAMGIVYENAGGLKFKPEKVGAFENRPKTIPASLNVGFALEPGTKHSKFRILLDGRDLTGNQGDSVGKKAHLGFELTIRDIVGFTAGLNQGYATAGMYLDIRILRLDFASYTEELGDRAGARGDTRYVLRLKMGF